MYETALYKIEKFFLLFKNSVSLRVLIKNMFHFKIPIFSIELKWCVFAHAQTRTVSALEKKIVRSSSDLRNCAYYIHCITHTEQTLLRMRIQWPISLEISRCFKLKNLRVFVIYCYTHVTQLYFLFLMYSCPSSIFYLLFYSILFISSFFVYL